MTHFDGTQKDIGTISPQALHAALLGDRELAVIDVRNTLDFATQGHLLASLSVPLDRIEVDITGIVPRLNTPLVIHDGGSDGLPTRAARVLRDLGYTDISILEGGTAAWRDAGYELYTGVNVIGIAFGEYVEHENGTPHISARELKDKIDAGEKVVVLDSRPAQEFANFSIPGAIDLPGAELVYRFEQAVDDPEALVVVNCAGRTRSIIGAQALINAGAGNRVVSLANGTMDWLINGFDLDTGRKASLPAAPDAKTAQSRLETLRSRFPLSYVSGDQLRTFRHEHDAGERTLYLLDIRSQEEYERGHLPGSRWIPGGQLVQQVDRWAGTFNSRIVLVDGPDSVRAAITASWLLQINWNEVHILSEGVHGVLETGPEPFRIAAPPPPVNYIAPAALKADRAHATVIDLDASLLYRAGHVPGAHLALRTWLVENVAAIPGDGLIVLVSETASLAAFAAADLAPRTEREILVLEGGTNGWKAAGHALETGDTSLLHPIADRRLNPYEATEDAIKFEGFRNYLDWEVGLVAQIERDQTVPYRSFGSER